MIRKLVKADAWRGGAWRTRLFGGLLALALLPSFVGAQSIEDKYRAQRERRSQFNLASAPTMVLNVNAFQCGLTSAGDTCTDVFDSPTGGGGFWPTGSPNQYMFNSGLQVVGFIPRAATCTDKASGRTPTCFPWSGDTTGSFFMDAAGTRQHGTPITDIYNSLDAQDLANWPTPGSVPDFPTLSGIVDDTALFNDVLIGRKAASQQDSWVAYWDGDPNKTGGRTHPMGIIVEQRTMAWNYPEGNENVIYFIYRFTNATNNPVFQRVNEARYFGGANALPDAGWAFENVYVAFDSDPDVGPATNNYATGIMPFNMGIAYEGPFYDDAFDYPPDIFRAPFFTRAPGIVAMKYLKSPIDPATGEEVGLTSLSQHTNGGRFPDPSSVQQGWRYISLNVDAGKGDPACSFSTEEVHERRSCFLNQSVSDVRLFIGSGPFALGPGETATIAVAMFAAATVATPLITSGPDADNKPGLPSLQPGCAGHEIRPIEVASGWVRTLRCPGEGEEDVVDQFDVEVVPGSLLGRALVAQAIFDNKFLLGFSPEAPPFYLVPGDNRVTVVWEPTATEQTGDPFFAAAGDPENTLYDPNYREFDVEGYRIYRGTSPANMQLIAQFDKDGSVFTDVLCITPTIDEDTHLEAPPHVTGDPCTEINEYAIHSPFVQFRSVARLESGTPFLVAADTALAAEIRAGTSLQLEDTGIPFAYVDTDVRNGFQYFYKVTAFDINSVRSGPSSLESASPAKPTTPSKTSPNVTLASFTAAMMGGDQVLNPEAPLPTIDAQTGIFSGPMPPTNGIEAAFSPLVERLLPAFSLVASIDSIKPDAEVNNGCPNGSNAVGACWHMFVTFDKDGVKTPQRIDGWTPAWSSLDALQNTYQLGAVAINPDEAAAAQYGIPAANVAFNATLQGTFYQSIGYSAYEGQANRRSGSGGIPSNVIAGGSRWFAGTNNTIPDPAALIRVGHINGVDSIWKPVHHSRITEESSATYAGSTAMQCFGYVASALGRAADVQLRWGAAGAAQAFDMTHNVAVPFKPTVQASFGFLNTDANGNGVIDYDDFFYISNISAAVEDIGFCNHTHDPSKVVQLEATAKLQPVSVSGANNTSPSALTRTGTGFGLYINGEHYIFQLTALPGGNTVWTVRTYSGFVTASSGSATWNPSGYAFSGRIRPPMIPGLRMTFVSEAATAIAEGAVDLTAIHTVPDPYYAVSQFDLGPSTKELQFVNLPPRATIRIYSLAGVLVDIVNHDAPEGDGRASWNLRNRSNQFVGSGVYFYHVTTPDGEEHVGKFTVVNAGFSR